MQQRLVMLQQEQGINYPIIVTCECEIDHWHRHMVPFRDTPTPHGDLCYQVEWTHNNALMRHVHGRLCFYLSQGFASCKEAAFETWLTPLCPRGFGGRLRSRHRKWWFGRWWLTGGVRDCSRGACVCVSLWARCVGITFGHQSCSLHMVRREIGVGLA